MDDTNNDESGNYYANVPPLKFGDYVEILPSGKRGTLLNYLDDDDRWGIELDGVGGVMLVRHGISSALQMKIWG